MRTWVVAAAVLAPLFISGCMSAEELRAKDEQTCRDYGFKRRNDAFAECLQRLDLDRRAQSRADRVALYDMDRDFRYRRYWYRPYYPRPSPPKPPPKTP